MVLKQLEEYFKEELNSLNGFADKDARWYAVQRCLGATQFVEMFHPEMSFVEMDSMFEYYKEKIMEG